MKIRGRAELVIFNIFNWIPVQLAKDNKKFQISKVAHGAMFKDYRGGVEWLADAGGNQSLLLSGFS